MLSLLSDLSLHIKQTPILLCHLCYPTFFTHQTDNKIAYLVVPSLLSYILYTSNRRLSYCAIFAILPSLHIKQTSILLCHLCHPSFFTHQTDAYLVVPSLLSYLLYTSNRRLSCCAIFAILHSLHIKQTPILLCHLCYPTFFTHQTDVYLVVPSLPSFLLYTSNRRLSSCAIFAILPSLHIRQEPIRLRSVCAILAIHIIHEPITLSFYC